MIPVGGVLLGESIIEPLSGKMVRVGGASVRAGQLFPNAGGHQTLLDSKVLQGFENFCSFRQFKGPTLETFRIASHFSLPSS